MQNHNAQTNVQHVVLSCPVLSVGRSVCFVLVAFGRFWLCSVGLVGRFGCFRSCSVGCFGRVLLVLFGLVLVGRSVWPCSGLVWSGLGPLVGRSVGRGLGPGRPVSLVRRLLVMVDSDTSWAVFYVARTAGSPCRLSRAPKKKGKNIS